MKRKRVNSLIDNELVKFGIVRQDNYEIEGIVREKTESRVTNRIEGIEREMEKQLVGGTAEKKKKRGFV